MINIERVLGNAVTVRKLAKPIAWWASKHILTRLLQMAAVGLIAGYSYFYYHSDLVSEYIKTNEQHTTQYNMLIAESRVQNTLDYLDLCIRSKQNDNANSEYYCQQAVAFYEETFVATPNNMVTENVSRFAHGAMRVEIANKLRVMVVRREVGESPGMNKTLEFLISSVGILIAVILCMLAMIGSILCSHHLLALRKLEEK